MRRYLSILLSLVLVLTMLPAAVFSDEYVEEPITVEEPAPAPAPEPEPAPAPAPEPEPAAEEPENVPVEEPAEEPAEEPTKETVEEPAEEPTKETVEEPAEEPAKEPVEEPAEEPAKEPAEEPAKEPVEEPAEEPAKEPVEELAEEPAKETVEEPAEESTEEPEEEVTEGYAIVLKDTDLYMEETGEETLAGIKKDAIIYVKVSEESRWSAFLWVGEEGVEAFIAAEDVELLEEVNTQAEKHEFQEIEVFDMTDFVVLPEPEVPAEEAVEEPAEEQAEVVEDPMLLSADEAALRAFVGRCYEIIQGRAGEEGGVTFWIEQLRAGTFNGATLVQFFANSDEFVGSNYSNAVKIQKIYETMLDRNPDAGGKKYWMDRLNAGVSLDAIISQFANSNEFKKICDNFGITPGLVPLSQEDFVRSVIVDVVTNCYESILGRDASAKEMKTSVDSLRKQKLGGANLVDQLITGAEYAGLNKSAEDTIIAVYKAMLNREPSAEEIDSGLDLLEKGGNLRSVVQQLSTNADFTNYCAAHSIIPGTVSIPATEVNSKVRGFVERCYTEALARASEADGMEYWCGEIISGRWTAGSVAKQFAMSDECVGKFPTNTEAFVDMLYHLYMDRGADAAGKNYWLGQIANGTPRDVVIDLFSGAREFRIIVAGYGLGPMPETQFKKGDIVYGVIDDNNVLVKKYNGTASQVEIPEKVTSERTYTVIKIGESAFEGNETLQSITLPNTIQVIMKAAFKNCKNLSNMNSK